MNKLMLGVNIDHIATLRNSRGTTYPDPIQAAFIAEQSGADSITVHLREDRRHINDRDIQILSRTLDTSMNLEIAITREMLSIARDIKPLFCCLVPEKRKEITTENGLNIIEYHKIICDAYNYLTEAGIQVSLFINADFKQIKAAADIGIKFIEIHTGFFADAKDRTTQFKELDRITKAAAYAASLNLKVKAGHGLNYHNVQAIAKIPEIYELNIGHSIIGRAVITGMKEAVEEMKYLILEARR